MFYASFSEFAAIGDIIICGIGEFTFKAQIVPDEEETNASDFNYSGAYLDTTCPYDGEENAKHISAWERDKWFYCGIEVKAYNTKTGDLIEGDVYSFHGAECNFPGRSNSPYLTEIANNCLSNLESFFTAREQRG